MDHTFLNDHNIKCVMNVGNRDNRHQRGMREVDNRVYYELPIEDSSYSNLHEVYPTVLGVAQYYWSKGESVLLHCKHGGSR